MKLVKSSKSKIEWCTHTFNPVTGCTPIADGCENCYALASYQRLAGMGVEKYASTTVTTHPYDLDHLARARNPREVFVCSMSDLFHSHVPFVYTRNLLIDLRDTNNGREIDGEQKHNFIFLTKRPGIMVHTVDRIQRDLPDSFWFGTSISSESDIKNIDILRKINHPNKFISIEPLLGSIPTLQNHLDGIKGVIVGCESGPNRRPCYIRWIEDIVLACEDMGIPVFVKQADINGKIVKMPRIFGDVRDELPWRNQCN